jgi:hypothetical protein
MKKLYAVSLSALMLFASVDAVWAQSRKTWDFTKGWSDATKENLNADANWVTNRTDATTGVATGWKDGTLLSGTLTANGEVISELEGLVFGTASLNKGGNNFLLDPGSIRMSRANSVVNLPKLANGQQVTIEAKSANSSDARGITANTDVLVKESGPEGDVAAGSEGHQTWVWHVATESEDSVDVSFKILNGGVDIYLIQIDRGDEGDMDEATRVAYLYDGSIEGYDVESDPIYLYTAIGELETSTINLANYDSSEKSLADSLETFGVVVYSQNITGATPNVDLLFSELNRVPILNLNASLYEAWGQGSVVTPSPSSSNFTLSESAAESTLFEGCGVTGTEYPFFIEEGAVEGTKVLAYQLNEGSEFADDEVLATVNGANAIHVHGTKNTYMLLPFSAEFALDDNGDLLFDTQIFNNAISYLADSKAKVQTASKPAVKFTYEDGKTTVTLSSGITGAKIFYTTDGTEPTTASTRYTEPLVYTTEGVISAIVTAPAYNQSNVLSETVIVKTQLAQPTYSVQVNGGVAEVTLQAAEGNVYYNITGAADTLKSSKFDPETGLQITRPTILTAFAAADGKLPSELIEFAVDLADKTYYNDTLVHLTFQEEGWTPGTNLVAQTKYFSDIKADSTITVNEDGTQDTTYTYQPLGELYEVETIEGWKVQSYGQRILVQTTGTSENVMSSYGPATALDAGATKNALSFLQAGASGDPATAALISTTTYAAPFVIGVHFTGQAESGDGKLDGTYREALAVSVSTDGETWTLVDTLATNYMKLMSYQTAEVAGTGNYYVKVASANPAKTSNKQKTMIFDVRLYGPTAERPSVGIAEVMTDAAKTVKSVRMYNLAGQQIRVATPGVNIIRTVYTDGSVSSKKVVVR